LSTIALRVLELLLEVHELATALLQPLLELLDVLEMARFVTLETLEPLDGRG
jgi:hypothetical protein